MVPAAARIRALEASMTTPTFPARAISGARPWRRGRALWIAAAGIVAVLALGGSLDVWPHLLSNVLPRATWNTLLLLGGVGTITGIVGCGTAWLVTAYDFPLRRQMEWALLLPLAVPTYIVAYAYLDLL